MTSRNLSNKIIDYVNKIKDDITECEWCGMRYPKGGWTYYKIRVRNMSTEKIMERVRNVSAEKIMEHDFDEHIICSDCYDHLEQCKEC